MLHTKEAKGNLNLKIQKLQQFNAIKTRAQSKLNQISGCVAWQNMNPLPHIERRKNGATKTGHLVIHEKINR